MNLKNILLTASIISFALGFSELQENLLFWLGRPVGAILFILYFILAVLEKEYAIADVQEAASSVGSPAKKSPTKAPKPALATATR